MAEAAGGLVVAILGAESTGKTTLASALAARLAVDTGRRVAWVPEYLREWCDHVGRTPQAHEQASILRTQHERIEAAALAHDIVVCDTTGVMTAVYSALLFGDRSLEAPALARHRRVALTLLMALDLPWVSDGFQRDGPQVRAPVDAAIRALLQSAGLPFAVIGGSGEQRLERAVAAVQPLLAPREAGLPRGGLFTGLGGARHERWACACCDVPEYEQALRRR